MIDGDRVENGGLCAPKGARRERRAMATQTLSAKNAAECSGEQLPEEYIQKVENRFERLDVNGDEDFGIPTIDFGGNREDIVKAVAEACRKWGFFQVVNHGLPTSTTEALLKVARDFFHLSEEDKEECNLRANAYPDDPAGFLKYGTGFLRVDGMALEWRDYLRISSLVKELDAWPLKPSSLKDVFSDYLEHITRLSRHLLEIISEGLGLESKALIKQFGKHPRHTLLMNYYPAFKKPELVRGISAHSDFVGITVLLQDKVGGLEVCNNGRWIPVKPIDNALVVNLGDQLEVMTNGLYKSPEHRARVNSVHERISIVSFYAPELDLRIGPMPEFVSGSKPALYRDCANIDWAKHCYSRQLAGKSNLDFVKI